MDTSGRKSRLDLRLILTNSKTYKSLILKQLLILGHSLVDKSNQRCYNVLTMKHLGVHSMKSKLITALTVAAILTSTVARADCYEIGRSIDQNGNTIVTTQCAPTQQYYQQPQTFGQPQQVIPGQQYQQPSYNPQGEIIAGVVMGAVVGALLGGAFDDHDHYNNNYGYRNHDRGRGYGYRGHH